MQLNRANLFKCEEFEAKLLNDVHFRESLMQRSNPVQSNQPRKSTNDDDGARDPSPPEILQKPKNIFAYEEDDLTLEVRVSGQPEPKVFWFKDGAPLQVNERVGFHYDRADNGVAVVHLKIQLLMGEDAGAYTLLAVNQHGVSLFSVNLNINIVNDERNQQAVGNQQHQQQQQVTYRR